MDYVYILSDYGEYGAKNVHATLDRAIIRAILEMGWPGFELEQEALLRLLEEKPDSELLDRDGIDLSTSWGGVQLHVVKLEP